MSDKHCISCDAPYGQSHLKGCVRYIPPTAESLEISRLEGVVAALTAANKTLREALTFIKDFAVDDDIKQVAATAIEETGK